MTKMYFDKTVKYNGTKYLPHVEVEVDDNDVNGLKSIGGWVVEKGTAVSEQEAPVEETAEEQVEEVHEEKHEEPKSELELLREKARIHGIDYKKNWGVKKLKDMLGL